MSQIPGLGFRQYHTCYMPKIESRSSRIARSLRTQKPPAQPATKCDEIPNKSLIALLPKTGYLLIAVSIAAAAVSSLIMSRILDLSHSELTIVLSIVYYLGSSVFIISVAFNPAIRQAPQSPGPMTFVFFFAWVVSQVLCFFKMNILWSHDWPTDTKNLAVSWMLLSLVSIAIYIFALIRIMAASRKDRHSKKPDLEAAEPASPFEKSPPKAVEPIVQDDEKAHWEHVEYRSPQPVYVHVPPQKNTIRYYPNRV
ncbi:hypothetical protein CcaCcLH18_00915 [Colletotrichum camelliae]|nr:hypothetical protein CcaCcLH18_00915 [Colletotrichum camelliae]